MATVENHVLSLQASPPDPRFDSFAQANWWGRVRILQRAFLSTLALVGFLVVPTMRWKAAYVLRLARLPLFKRFSFFRTMFALIDDAKRERGKR